MPIVTSDDATQESSATTPTKGRRKKLSISLTASDDNFERLKAKARQDIGMNPDEHWEVRVKAGPIIRDQFKYIVEASVPEKSVQKFIRLLRVVQQQWGVGMAWGAGATVDSIRDAETGANLERATQEDCDTARKDADAAMPKPRVDAQVRVNTRVRS